MGSGASNFAQSQNLAITSKLREEYTRIKTAHVGLSDEELYKQLEAVYHQAVTDTSIPEVPSHSLAPTKMGSPKTTSATKIGLKAPGVLRAQPSKNKLAGVSGSQKTRRRSFGDEKDKIGNAAQKSAQLAAAFANQSDSSSAQISELVQNMTVSRSTPALAVTDASLSAPPPAKDCWDSVDEQPYCKVCSMAFKTEAFLERHIKYSDMHAKAIAKGESSATEALVEPKLQKQEEGVHYKLVYSGSKLFWRTQETIDIDIYHHLVVNVVEVIMFEPIKGKELKRVYLDCGVISLIVDRVVESEVQDKLQLMQNAHKANKFGKDLSKESSIPDMTSFVEETRRQTFTSFVLSRLHMSSGETVYVPTSGDDSALRYIIPDTPSGLVPVVVNRRRRTNSDEINRTLLGLDSDRAALAIAIGHAEKVASTVHASVDVFARVNDVYKGLNAPRRRWLFAIRKVIRIAYVQKVRARIAELEQMRKDAAKLANRGARTSIRRARDL